MVAQLLASEQYVAIERGTTVSNPQEPHQPDQNQPPQNQPPQNQPPQYQPPQYLPPQNQPGQNPPPVPPGPGYPPQSGASPQWQQPASDGSQANPPYPAPGGQYPQTGNPYPQTPPGNPYPQNPYPPAENQPGQYPPGQYAQPPKKNRKVLWIVLGIVAGLIVLVVVGILVLVNVVGNATSKARSLGDEFTTLIVAGQTEKAYDDYLGQPLKNELDKQAFIDGIESLNLDSSCKPNYNSVSVNNDNGNNKADLTGKLQCDGKTIDLRYVFEGTNDLKMTTIRLRP